MAKNSRLTSIRDQEEYNNSGGSCQIDKSSPWGAYQHFWHVCVVVVEDFKFGDFYGHHRETNTLHVDLKVRLRALALRDKRPIRSKHLQSAETISGRRAQETPTFPVLGLCDDGKKKSWHIKSVDVMVDQTGHGNVNMIMPQVCLGRQRLYMCVCA